VCNILVIFFISFFDRKSSSKVISPVYAEIFSR